MKPGSVGPGDDRLPLVTRPTVATFAWSMKRLPRTLCIPSPPLKLRIKQMPQRKIHSVNKALTEEERVRHRAIREQVEQEKAALIARGRRAKARHTMLKEAVAVLKTTREALGLSLADIKASTGIEKR